MSKLFIFCCADAVRDVRSQFPEDMELYNFGTSPCSEASAKSLLREMERSPLKPPPADETQSFEGKYLFLFMRMVTVREIHWCYGLFIFKI